MIGFMEELWQSIFTPGTTPTLVLATHVTFALLVVTLLVFVYLSGSIHLINLLVLSILLWITLTWFIAEINKENAKEDIAGVTAAEKSPVTSASTSTSASATTSTATPTTRKSRKI